MIRCSKENHVEMEIVTDPVECAEFAQRQARFKLNLAWFNAHASEVYSHRDKYICVAGQELFVGDSVKEVVAAAKAAHPEDDGRFTKRIPLERPVVRPEYKTELLTDL